LKWRKPEHKSLSKLCRPLHIQFRIHL
jgi:hypothetical protein